VKRSRTGVPAGLFVVGAIFGVAAWLSGSVVSDRQAPGVARLLERRAGAPSPSQQELDEGRSAREVVVDFRDDVPHERLARLGERLGIELLPSSSQVDVDEIYVVRTDRPDALIRALAAEPDVEAVSPQTYYRIPEGERLELASGALPTPEHAGFPNDPHYKLQWHLAQIHAAEAWKRAQGEGVTVAVIDTGVARVPDLAATELVEGYNFVDDNKDAADDHGHGTHVAGTIAQSTHNGVGVAGVAWKSKIMPIKVLSARGSGSVAGIAEGIRFAADHGAKVINMSLGGPLASSVLRNAVDYAHSKGVVVVCAAGNDGRGRVSFPAAYAHSIAVAATQFDGTTTFYSNWGKEIDVAAPGGNTRVDQNGDGLPDGVLQNTVVPGQTDRNDYLWFMGTSMASPHVAGVAALVVSAGVTDPDAVEKVLKETARPPAQKSGDSAHRYGAGLIDAQAAVAAATRDVNVYPLVAALGLVGLALTRLRGRGLLSAGGLGLTGLVGLVVGSSGLFFLPWLGIDGSGFWGRGLPAWDLGLGAALHGSPVAYSAVVPVMATLLLLGVGRLRGLLAGLSFGVSGHLVATALLGTTQLLWLPAPLGLVWLLLQAGLAALLGYATLLRRPGR
jgi:serine protease